MYAPARVGLAVGTQCTRCCRGNARSAAIAGEVSLLEDLDEGVFAVALDGTGVADARGNPFLCGRRGGRVACQACEDILSQGPKDLGAGIDTLSLGSARSGWIVGCSMTTNIWQSLARISFEGFLVANKPKQHESVSVLVKARAQSVETYSAAV